MALILPSYLAKKTDYRQFQVERFKKRLDAFIDEHQDYDEPYFILYKSDFNSTAPDVEQEVMSFYRKKPPFVRNSMVFWVDNSRGLAIHLWTVDTTKQIRFNTKTAERLKGILRSAAD